VVLLLKNSFPVHRTPKLLVCPQEFALYKALFYILQRALYNLQESILHTECLSYAGTRTDNPMKVGRRFVETFRFHLQV
jgi:hypothetical protein